MDLFIIHPDIVKMQLHRDWQEAGESLQNYDKECTDDGMEQEQFDTIESKWL